MNTKFTKGEWIAVQMEDVNSIYNIHYTAPDSEYSQASITLYNQDNAANAHLISAAPDMYELLKEFIPMDEDGNGEFQYNEGSEYLGKKVIELLTKARGE